MGFIRQTKTLTRKTLLIIAWRQCISTALRAVVFPIALAIILCYVQNIESPPLKYGIGSPRPIRNISDTFSSNAVGRRRRLVFCNSGFTGGNIERVIEGVAAPLRRVGADIHVVSTTSEIAALCPTSSQGTSSCYAAVTFLTSPGENGTQWLYNVATDVTLGYMASVNRGNSDAEVFSLPLGYAIDSQIATLEGKSLPSTIYEYPYTSLTQQEASDLRQRSFMSTVDLWLGVCLFLTMCGITFHVAGFIATERELGISQLIDSMVPDKYQIIAQFSRLVSTLIAFQLVYIPGWISVGAAVSTLIFLKTSHAMVILFHLLTGMALTSYAAFGASLFRRAQLSGISVLIIALIGAVVAQYAPIRDESGVSALCVLFPSTNYTYFLQFLAKYERNLRPANLTEDVRLAGYFDNVDIVGYKYFVYVVVQILYYPVLTALVEYLRFGIHSKGRRLTTDSSKTAIQIQNFSKRFYTGFWQSVLPNSMTKNWKSAPVEAVNGLDLTVLHGEIMCLLGPNGSGKSTTLNTIAGNLSPSQGSIQVDRSGGIGICPQNNVMWSELTVMEHIAIFDQLKSETTMGTTQELETLIRGCDLENKANKKAKTLSGGQKRKLQLAMAFAGGSQVCCIDEASSGLDPLSRRKIWNILLNERGKRTLLFTTHALDEANALSDQVAIMAGGFLKVKGSIVELQDRYGNGYKVHCLRSNGLKIPRDIGHQYKIVDNEIIFQAATSHEATQLAQKLAKQYNILPSQIHSPTIEDVFLKVASVGPEGLLEDVEEVTISPAKFPNPEMEEAQQLIELDKGQDITVFHQAWVLFRKRIRILTNNYMPYVCALGIPMITAGLVPGFLVRFKPLLCEVGNVRGYYGTTNLTNMVYSSDFALGPTSTIDTQQLPPILLNESYFNLQMQNTYDSFQEYIRNHYTDVVPGGFYLDSPQGGFPTLAYKMDGSILNAVFAQNILNSYLAGTVINLQSSIFVQPDLGMIGESLLLVVFLGLAYSTFPALLALYPTYERLRNIRSLQYSNGIRVASLWLAYIIFDIIWISLISIATIIIFVQLSSAWYAPGYLWLVFFLFGIASTLLSYIISLFASSQMATFAIAAGGQAAFVLIYFGVSRAIVTSSIPEDIGKNLNILHFTLGLVTPSGNLLRALTVTLNTAGTLCRNQTYITYPGDIEAYGGPILYLVIQTVAYFTFLLSYDSGWRPRWSFFRRKRLLNGQNRFDVAMETLDEANRRDISRDALQILHLSKSFGSEVAVDDLTFGVKHGEVFALLGPNGAGKSTTISLIQGDLQSTTESDVLVEGVSIRTARARARRNLGVCPQFDAIDRMTVTEHLSFFARVCGVRNVRENVENVINAVGLTGYEKRMAEKLSGGNKRKLSVGISIIADPSVLLLDEPSSGMDAVSKRFMWKLLKSIKKERSLVLTTHSMEEASALADKVGIMAKKMLAIGTTQQLQTTYGNGFYGRIVHQNTPDVSEIDQNRLTEWVRVNIPDAVILNGGMIHGQLKFYVKFNDDGDASTTGSTTISNNPSVVDTMCLLEENKDTLGIAFYSVIPTTLEDVFLDLVQKQGFAEHETHKPARLEEFFTAFMGFVGRVLRK